MILSNKDSVITKAVNKLYVETIENCPKCAGSDPACVCWAKMRMYEKCARADVPIIFWRKKFSEFGLYQDHNPVVVDLKEGWHDIIYDANGLVDSGRFIVVTGPNGTGKTMMTCMALKSAMLSKHSGQYVLYNNLIDINHITDYSIRRRKMEWIHSCDVLVIDELGKEYKKMDQLGDFDKTSNMASYSRFVIEGVLKTRSDSGLVTFVVTNDLVNDLKEKYGGSDSAFNSLLEAKNTIIFHHAGIDFRGVDGQ